MDINSNNSIVVRIKRRMQLLNIDKIAREVNFIKRKPKKIRPLQLLTSFVLQLLNNNSSYSSIAEIFSLLTKETIAKQSIQKRIEKEWIRCLQSVLSGLLTGRTYLDYTAIKSKMFYKFKRVLVQDSTNISLPAKLAQYYPGGKNSTRKKYSSLKIQGVIDLLSERFKFFKITPFTKNDQSQSGEILKVAQNQDLIIRDLGYFGLKVFSELIKKGIFFLSRLMYGINIYNPDTGKKINLLKELKANRWLDINVLLGTDDQIPVRLVAIPLPQAKADEKRRKAKQDRDRRKNHSKEYMILLGWNIYITNVSSKIWKTKDVAKAYSFRWRIEIIFKAWKSNFNIANVPNSSKYMVESFIYSALIFITLFQTSIWVGLNKIAENNPVKIELSLLKVSKFVKQYWLLIILHYQNQSILLKLLEIILYHCQYEKRNKRLNFAKQCNLLS